MTGWWVGGALVALLVLGFIGAVTRRREFAADLATLPEDERRAWNVDDSRKRGRARLLIGILVVLVAVGVGVASSLAASKFDWLKWGVPVALLIAAWGVNRISLFLAGTVTLLPRTLLERVQDQLAGYLSFVPFALGISGVLLAVRFATPYLPLDIDVGRWVTWGILGLGGIVFLWKRSGAVALFYLGIAYLARLAVEV